MSLNPIVQVILYAGARTKFNVNYYLEADIVSKKSARLLTPSADLVCDTTRIVTNSSVSPPNKNINTLEGCYA
jgi:hypothetical protein